MLNNFGNIIWLMAKTGCDFLPLEMKAINAQPFAVQNTLKTS